MKFLIFLLVVSFLNAANFLPENIEKMLDIDENKTTNTYENRAVILNDKLSYDEFIEKRWQDNIEMGESWGTEIIYKFYMLDVKKDINSINKSIKSNSKHLTNENILEIRAEIDKNFENGLLNKDEKNLLEHTLNTAEIAANQYNLLGGDSGSGGGSCGGDGGGDGD